MEREDTRGEGAHVHGARNTKNAQWPPEAGGGRRGLPQTCRGCVAPHTPSFPAPAFQKSETISVWGFHPSGLQPWETPTCSMQGA